jgi:hypothetical protein
MINVLLNFVGTARTSLVVTIGPSPRHRGETTSTIMFGQRVRSTLNDFQFFLVQVVNS